MVIVEYCRFGNLHNYLLRHRNNFINQIDPNTGKFDPTIGMDILKRTDSVSSNNRFVCQCNISLTSYLSYLSFTISYSILIINLLYSYTSKNSNLHLIKNKIQLFFALRFINHLGNANLTNLNNCIWYL